MNGNLKSKFRDRLKYFKRLFLLRRKKGINLEENNNIDKVDNKEKIKVDNVVNNKNNIQVNHYKRKRVVGIGDVDNVNKKINSSNVINNDIKEYKEVIVNQKLVNKSMINNKKVVNNKGVDNNNEKIIGKKSIKFNKRKKVGIEEVNNSFDKDKHIEKNDRELLLDTIVYKLDNKTNKMIYKLNKLHSDYFNLVNYCDEEIEKEECEKRLKEIERIKKELEDIEKQFNIINDDKYLDNILEMDDSNLIDDIIKYKKLCEKINDKKELYDKYKELENHEKINYYLDKFTKKVDELEEQKEKKKEELEKRDKDFKIFKESISSVDVKNERYFLMLNKHVDISNNLLKKVDDIFKRETVDYRLKGLGDLVSSSFKYLFYLSLSPFRGVFPSIAIHTLATRDMIRSIRDSMEIEKIVKINYYAKDYEYEINRYLYDVNDLNNLLYNTRDDIKYLKKEFDDKYGKYINDISEYKDIYKKIEKIEKMVDNNIERVSSVEKELNKSKQRNKDKLIKIKKLNS